MVLTLGLQQCSLNYIYLVKLRYQLNNEFQRYNHQNLFKNWSKIIIFIWTFLEKSRRIKPPFIESNVRFHEEWNEQSKTLKFKNELHRNSFSLFVLCITLFVKNTIFFGWQNVLFAVCVFWKLWFLCFSSQKLSVNKMLYEIHMIYWIK